MKKMAAILRAVKQRRRNPREGMPVAQSRRLARSKCQCRTTYVSGRPETIKCLSCIARDRILSANPCCRECAENPGRVEENPMSRKDYVAFADALRGSDSRCAGVIADVLQKDNSRFDRGRFLEAASNPDVLNSIRAGDRITIVNGFGQKSTGRAVMRGPYGWVLNMGSRHGTPDIATDENIVKISPSRSRSRNPELLVVGLNPEGGKKVSHCIKVKSHRRCYKKGSRKVKGRRVRSRGRKSHARRGRGKPRSWRAFVRKHRGVMKRLGLKRGIRKIGKMWKRLK